MNISLPQKLREWVNEQVVSRGFGTASEFVRDTLRRERDKAVRVQVDHSLIEAMKEPATEMTDNDWKKIESEGRKRAKNRKKA